MADVKEGQTVRPFTHGSMVQVGKPCSISSQVV
jgi:hypothetical protein